MALHVASRAFMFGVSPVHGKISARFGCACAMRVLCARCARVELCARAVQVVGLWLMLVPSMQHRRCIVHIRTFSMFRLSAVCSHADSFFCIAQPVTMDPYGDGLLACFAVGAPKFKAHSM